jgi:hypothetical protein
MLLQPQDAQRNVEQFVLVGLEHLVARYCSRIVTSDL